MKLTVETDGKIEINQYYFQTLCMIFWPGVRFGAGSENDEDAPAVSFRISTNADGVTARVTIADKIRMASVERSVAFSGENSAQMTAKLAAGSAILAAGAEFMHYSPSWGVMTGVRPSKVASEYLRRGYSAAKTRAALRQNYYLFPKKASLVTEIAQLEAKLAKPYYNGWCSLYVSIPFCPSRCAYCSFVSYTSKKLLSLIPTYVDFLCEEIDLRLSVIRELGLKVASVYIGGGTPTILTEEQLERVLTHINNGIDMDELAEFTLEAGRPDTITQEKLRIAKRLGVTRISVNTQTINNTVLESIGRAHTAEDFFRAYELAVNSDIDCINTDLIAGLPGENFISFSQSFDKVLELHPENITVHTFSVKKAADILKHGASVYSRVNNDAGKSVDYSQIRAKESGYRPYYLYRQKNTVGNYENVGFALKGYEGLYNIFMMEEIHTVFAAGAGAVNRLVQPTAFGTINGNSPKIKRIFNPKYPYEYLSETDPARRAASIIEDNKKIIEFYMECGSSGI